MEVKENGWRISSVPDYCKQVDSTPEDPEGSVSLMAQSDNAVCFVMDVKGVCQGDGSPDIRNHTSVLDLWRDLQEFVYCGGR